MVTEAGAPRRAGTERELLAGCDPEQALAITTEATPLCVVAGAGSGKTRVLTRRIAWRVMAGSAAAGHVLALTFTRKAALELRSRLRALGLPEAVVAGTFHAVALAELKRLAAERGQQAPVVLGSKVRLLAEVLEAGARGGRSAPGWRETGGGRAGAGLAELAAEIEWAKSRCLRPEDLAGAGGGRRRTALDPAETAEIWVRYESLKRRRGVLDFEDLLVRCAAELEGDPGFAASARWRYRHVFVDEYQDVNLAQQRLLRAWLGPNDDLCVVGDPHQAIYSWNGSNPRAMADFPSDFPGGTVVRLCVNYRSSQEVLAVAGAVLGDKGAGPAVGVRPDGPIPTVRSFPDELAEAAGIAEAARRARRPGRRWSQMAVLARTNAQLRVLEDGLSAAGVPCQVSSAAGLLRTAWVREALQEAARAADAGGLAAWAADLRASLRAPGEGGDGSRPGDEARPDLEALAELASEYLEEGGAVSGAGFRSWLEAAAARDYGPGRGDAVHLTTFHRAKGLEWAVLFVAGLEDGLVPIAHARDPESLAEERRLLYVACTRAEEELHCSWAEERSFVSGRPVARSPSPWLSAVEAARHDLQRLRRSAPEAARRALAESRRALGLS